MISLSYSRRRGIIILICNVCGEREYTHEDNIEVLLREGWIFGQAMYPRRPSLPSNKNLAGCPKHADRVINEAEREYQNIDIKDWEFA